MAANALEGTGAGVVVAASKVGAAPSKALETGKLARGGRLDEGYQVGDLTIGAVVTVADTVGGAVGAVAEGVFGTVGAVAGGVFGSSAQARWVFADESGFTGSTTLYRSNALRWNTGTLDAIAAELDRQRGKNARRRIVLRYTERVSEREAELGTCREAAEWIRAYQRRHGR